MSRSRTLIAAALMVAVSLLVSPAHALDDELENPNDCSGPFGDAREGTVIVLPPGLPPSSGLPPVFSTDSQGNLLNNYYQCIGGHWVLVVSAFEVGLSVAADAASVTTAEGSPATMTGTYQYAGEEPLSLAASFGVVTDLGGGVWSWSFTPDDGPATHTVTITGTAGDRQAQAGFDLVVDNVAPTVTSLVPSTTMALTGQPISFAGTATDPSADDTSAGFTWSPDGAASFETCGSHTIDATATDKDGGVSAPLTSSAVEVVEAALAAPLTPGARNLVRAGQVVPVRLTVGCGGVALGGLAPAVSLVRGDVDPATTSDDPALVVPPADAPGDTTGIMRDVGGSYLYDLRVPDGPSGALYTVRVRPAAGAGPLDVVLQLR